MIGLFAFRPALYGALHGRFSQDILACLLGEIARRYESFKPLSFAAKFDVKMLNGTGSDLAFPTEVYGH